MRIWGLRCGDDDNNCTSPHGRGLRSLVYSVALEFWLEASLLQGSRVLGRDGFEPLSPLKKNPLVETVCSTFQACPFREGPRVRILLPPAASLVRTGLPPNRHIGKSLASQRTPGLEKATMNLDSNQREGLFREFAQYQKQRHVIIAYRDTADDH